MKQPPDTAAKSVPALSLAPETTPQLEKVKPRNSTALPRGETPSEPGVEDAHATCNGQVPAFKRIEIHFDRAGFEGCELEFMEQAVRGGHISGDGPFTHNCQAWLETALGVQKALLTTSCTDALEMAAVLLKLQPGDEVIVPSFTFVSSVNAFVLHGARPVFSDIRSDTFNLDEARLERHISPHTRAIVAVHYAGVGCEMQELLRIAARSRIAVIEDNAHGLLGKYRNRFLGTFGSLATLSFHGTKNFTCGEGGALLINDERYVERAEIIWEKGTNRARFFRGLADKYTWRDVGSSFLPSDLLAAFLYAQFLAAHQIQAKRRRVWQHYLQHLRDWARCQHVRLPFVPLQCEQAYHMFYLLMPTPASRQALIAHLRSRGILSAFHYLPLHLSEMGRRFGGKPGLCPVAEQVSDRILRLPFYNDLTGHEQDRVVEAVQEFSV
jgi:dTDP-4-amino-4,6-dideoxygalactose transaminase